jgi:hypothetical protein
MAGFRPRPIPRRPLRPRRKMELAFVVAIILMILESSQIALHPKPILDPE